MNRTTSTERSTSLLLAALTGAFLVAFVAYMWRLRPVVAFMDTLRFLSYYDDSVAGRRSLWATWNQGEHHGMLPQIFVYLNARFFGFRVFPATVLSGGVIAVCAWLLGAEMRRTLRERSSQYAGTFAASLLVLLLALFSLANWELYSVDVGATLFLKNLSFIAYWIALERALRPDASRAWRVAVLAGGPVIILLIGYGWSYAFALASAVCVLLARDAVRSFRWSVLLSLGVSVALYVLGGALTSGLGPGAAGQPASVWNAVQGIPLAFSAIFLPAETAERYGLTRAFPLALAGVLLALALFVLVARLRSPRALPLVPFALLLYAAATGCSVAYARGRFDPALAMAPRYFLDLSLGMVAVAWWAALTIKAPSAGTARAAAYVAAGVAVVFAAGQVLVATDEWNMAQYRSEAFQKIRDVTLSGKVTPEQAALLQQPLPVATRGVAIQAERQLGPFRTR